MLYREIQPRPPLNGFVECFWTLEGDSAPVQTERILPDGCVELILNFGAQFCQHNPNGHKNLQPRQFVVGQMTGPILISPTGRVELLGIRFHPGGTFAFLRVPMHEVTDQVIELGSLSCSLKRDLTAVSADLPSLLLRVTAIEKLLIRRVLHYSQDWVMELAARIIDSGGLVSVDQLSDDAGISSRQL